MFVSPLPIPNIESFPQSTILLFDSGSFGRNRADVNIQQHNTSKVADTDTVMTDNEEIDPSPPQDIINIFAAADLLSSSSSDLDKYKRAWLKVKVFCSCILSDGGFPDACSIALSIALNHKKIASMVVTDAI